MFRMDIQNLTNRLVEQFIGEEAKGHHLQPDGSLPTIAMHLFYDVSLISRGTTKTYERRAGLHLLYAKTGFNYIHVFSANTSTGNRKAEDVSNWLHQGSHDSEWRNTKAFIDPFFAMAQQINDDRVADGLPEIAPISMSEQGYTTFGLFNQVFRRVQVSLSKDPSDQHNYRRLVKVLTEK